MKSTIHVLAVLAVLGVLLVLGSQQGNRADAFSFTGAAWTQPTATYFVNPSFTDGSAGSAQQQIAAIQRGASEWKSAGQVPFEFVYGGTTTVATRAPLDGTNAVFYSPTNGFGALAVATWSSQFGGILGFDIEFFDRQDTSTSTVDFVWSVNPSFSQFDIESVAVHEFGHALGLNHSSVNGATMFPSVSPGTTDLRTLHPDDIAGVQALYGMDTTAAPTISNIAPWFAWIGGGTRVTITGTDLAGGDVQGVTFDGLPAGDVTVVDSTRIECNLPQGTRPGFVEVGVSHAQGATAAANGFFNEAVRITQPVSVTTVGSFELFFPADGGLGYHGLPAFGFQGGIPLSILGDPTDGRVLPINSDGLLNAFIDDQFPNEFIAFQGTLDSFGRAIMMIDLPNIPQYVGFQICITALTNDENAQSGIKNIANTVVAVIAP